MKEKLKTFMKMPITWLLFGWNILLLIGLYKLMIEIGHLLIGHWRCDKCKAMFGVNDERKRTGVNDHMEVCSACYDASQARIRPPAPAAQGSAIKRPAAMLPMSPQQVRERGK